MDGALRAAAVAALVFAGGDPPASQVAGRLPLRAFVIAADSGIEHATALGRRIDLAVGDFDSVTPSALAEAERSGARIDRHPRDKDATDLELALDAAIAAHATRVTVVGGHGGRVDHFAANLLLLASPRYAAVALDAWFGSAHVLVVRSDGEVVGAPGELVTLLPVGGPATGVTTAGLRFPLDDAALEPGSTLGVSNELIDVVAHVSVRSGTVLVVQPHALRPSTERGQQ
jgi:thiamine pyrophosphokinase